MNIKFGVFWKQNLGTIYKDNSITTLGKEADVDLNLSEVSSIHANFKVDGKNYTSIVYIVDIEKGLIRIPFTREVLSIGMHELELVAVMKNGDVIPSQTFTYNIVESLDNLEDITEETNYPILIQILQDVNSKIAEIDDAIARIPSPEELKGEKGDKGDKGEQGIQGERGLQGIQGIRGEKGDKGDRGLQGIQGVKGEKGDKGERGERGLQGIQGNQGARGIQGEKGDKGETGVGLGFEWSGTRLGIKKDTDTSYKYVELKGDKGEQASLKNLVVDYIHQGNKEIYFESINWETGEAITIEPHNLNSPTQIMIVPNNWYLNEGTYYDEASIMSVPIEYTLYNKYIYIIPTGEKSLLITQNDKISKIDVNLNDVSNAKIDCTKFHFEIPIPFVIKNIPKDVFDYMVVQNGYIKGYQYRYTNHKYIQSDGTIKTGDYLNLLETPRGNNMNSYHCLYANQVWNITRHIYGCRMDVNSAIIGRRKGYNFPVLDLCSEKTERYYKCPQGYLTEFSTYSSHYAYLSNYSNIKIYNLGGRNINE